MAGDWIPLFVDTPSCPEIVRISSETQRTHNDVLAFSVRLWCYADRHSSDGFLRGVALKNLPDVLGGDIELWESFVRAGWLNETDEGLYLPGCKWLEKGGKARLKDSERKRTERDATPKRRPDSVRDLSGNSRTKTGPEKRREEKSIKEPPTPLEGDGEFELFWKSFPVGRREKRAKAKRAWGTALSKVGASRGLSRTEAAAWLTSRAVDYAASPQGRSAFVKGPLPWLNGGCWDDDPAAWNRGDDAGPRAPPPSRKLPTAAEAIRAIEAQR